MALGSDIEYQEETLDPKDWQGLRKLGHRMVDDMMTYLETVRERPVWMPIPEEVREHLRRPLPREPEGAEQAYQDFCQFVLPYPHGNIHPRFWGWVNGTGSPFGMLAEMLAAGMNSNVACFDQVSIHVESQVIGWCKEMLGYASEASGLLVSGGSMANLVGLTVARNAKAEFDIAKEGAQASPRKMLLYCSRETHLSIEKAVMILGLGGESLRKLPVDENYRINIEALQDTIATDRAHGHQPFCVIGNAGTVNTGAVDDLQRLVEICRGEDLWLHVDGAFGALGALSPRLQPLLEGMEQADSLAFDLHKWMFMPYEAGCVLVRNAEQHHRAFTVSGEYLARSARGLTAGGTAFMEYGVQLSRGFRALKVWLSLKEHGIEKYRRLIEQNVDQAQYLASLVESDPQLELMAPISLNVVCFRFVTDCLNDVQLDELNEELLIRLHDSGVALPSGTRVNGRYALRAAITNHRSRREDFRLMVKHVKEIGRTLLTSCTLVIPAVRD